jgi:hypothetical protein
MSAAALAGAQKAYDLKASVPLNIRKKEIDGAATAAAETVFNKATITIRVAAGEGQRDDSPGALVGQQLGNSHVDVPTDEQLDGVFDYVDGTSLAAMRSEGALALGGLGYGLRSVPDLQAYAVLAPRELLERIDIMSAPESHALTVLDKVAAFSSKSVSDLTVFTHSISSNLMHHSLIDLLKAKVSTLIVPEFVTVEPPYLLSLVGLAAPRIDSMIGAIGLSELAFAAMMLDLVCPDYGFVFRLGSISGPRRFPTDKTLWPLFEFSDEESQVFADAGLSIRAQYSSLDLVPQGSGLVAAIFAITDNPLLKLLAPSGGDDIPKTNGLLLERNAHISRVSVLYGGVDDQK